MNPSGHPFCEMTVEQRLTLLESMVFGRMVAARRNGRDVVECYGFDEKKPIYTAYFDPDGNLTSANFDVLT